MIGFLSKITSTYAEADSVCCFRSISSTGIRVCWELHAACNAFCKHCMVYDPVRDHMPLARMLKVADEMVAAGVQKVLLSGGEPLLFSGIEELAGKLAGQGVLVDVNTNGSLATSDRLSPLWDAGVRELTISLDAVTPSIFANCRPGLMINDVINGIRNAVRMGFDVDLTYVPTKLNISEFETVVNKAVQLGARSLTLAGLVTFQRAAVNCDVLQLAASQVADLCERIRKCRSFSKIPIRTNRLVTARPTAQCQAARTIWGIDASGFVHPCPLYILEPTEANDLQRRSFHEIIKDPSFLVNVPPLNGLSECFKCAEKNKCPGGCLGVKRLMDIHIGGPDPTCFLS